MQVQVLCPTVNQFIRFISISVGHVMIVLNKLNNKDFYHLNSQYQLKGHELV